MILSSATCIPQHNPLLMCFNSKAEMKETQYLNLSIIANVSCGLLIYETITTALRKHCLALNCKWRIITVFLTGSSENRSQLYRTFLAVKILIKK